MSPQSLQGHRMAHDFDSPCFTPLYSKTASYILQVVQTKESQRHPNYSQVIQFILQRLDLPLEICQGTIESGLCYDALTCRCGCSDTPIPLETLSNACPFCNCRRPAPRPRHSWLVRPVVFRQETRNTTTCLIGSKRWNELQQARLIQDGNKN